MTSSLEVFKISKIYGKMSILQGVSLSASSGSSTVIVGPSGAGKSTLLRVAAMLEPPDEGTVRFESKNGGVLRKPWPELTVVFQQFFLWPHLSLKQNIELPLRYSKSTSSSVFELAYRLDLTHLLDRYPNQVSAGQRQRAALARALLLHPKLLLLDEITSSLDAEQIELVLGVLKEFLDRGGGVVAVTHHVGFARILLQHSSQSRFIFLVAGSVIESGDTVEFNTPITERFTSFRNAMHRTA